MIDKKTHYRDVVAAYHAPRLAVAERSGVVRLFDLDSFDQVASFQTDMDFGGTRIAISPNGRFVAAASYDEGTTTVFDDNGSEIWGRDSLDEIQVVTFSADSETLYCSHHRGLVSAFDSTNGQSVRFSWIKKRIYGCLRIYESAYDDRLVLDCIESPLKVTTRTLKPIAKIQRKTFAVIAASFAPEFFCISESGGPITCYHVNGKEAWTLRHDDGVHAIRLSYDKNRKAFLGITRSYEKGGDQILLTLDAATGRVSNKQTLPDEGSFFFAPHHGTLVSSSGVVLDLATIRTVGRIRYS